MKKYIVTTNEDYAQDWVVEAASEEEAESRVSNGDGIRSGELKLIESCVDAFGGGEIDEETYADCVRENRNQPRAYLDNGGGKWEELK